ncbi:uncharacterized protein Dwil_GK22236 [Drosophila willistoni]|uniref:MD-2-related lipid-recognition domain-containing protein n=1 Tax=Drosophila willistoni TaxID=7260 RepID=B4MYJ8_DROWI|nr:uncharacterized protein LOC6643369 [Drosophila willistoni]EDW77187.1 uncharacterized protein Dwil_GK22236 [Drosophila willistoni]
MRYKFVLWLLFATIVGLVESKNDFEMQFENFTCSTDDDKGIFIQEFKCGLSKNLKRRTFSMEFMLKQTLNDHDFFMTIVLPRPNMRMDFVLLNLTTDGCQLLANKNQVPLMHMGRSLVERYSNLPKQCPFETGITYYIRGFRMDLSLIPAVEMETPVKVVLGYQRKHLTLVRGHLVARVQRTVTGGKKSKV